MEKYALRMKHSDLFDHMVAIQGSAIEIIRNSQEVIADLRGEVKTDDPLGDEKQADIENPNLHDRK